jgi:predicted ester cyclase
VATHEGEFLGIHPTHTQVTNKGITMFTVSDGKITEIWESADFLGFMQQLGAIPAAPVSG